MMNIIKTISPAFILVFLYAFFGILWITLSDSLLLYFVKDIDNLSSYQSYKGLAYIVFTTILLYILLVWSEKKRSFAIALKQHKVEHLNIILKLIRDINQSIARAKDHQELLEESCVILTSSTLYSYAWIELNIKNHIEFSSVSKKDKKQVSTQSSCDQAQTKSCIKLLSQSDKSYLYIEDINSSCGNCSIKDQNIVNENAYILKITYNNTHYGYMAVASYEQFDEEELSLLQEVARDIAYGIFNIENKRILKENEERYRFAVEGAKEGLWDWDLVNDKIYLSPRYKEIMGYADDELENTLEVWETRLHPDEKEAVLKSIQKSHENQIKEYQYIYRLQHRDGHWVWINDRAQTIFDADGKALRMIGSHSDISYLKETEKQLQLSMEKFEKAFNYTPNIIMISSVKTGEVYDVNKTFETLFGYSKEEVIGKTTLDIDLWFQKEDRKKYIQKFNKNQHINGDIYQFNTKNKIQLTLKVYASLVTIDNEEYILAVTDDITERNKLYNLIADSQAISHLGSWEQNSDNDTLLWSDEVYRIFEFDTNTVVTFEAFLNQVHPEDREELINSFQKSIKEHQKYYNEHRLLFADGRVKYLIERAEHFYDENGNHINTIGTVQDITEQFLAEDEIKKGDSLLSSIFEVIPDLLFIINDAYRIIDYRAKVDEELYTEPELFLGKEIQDILPKDIVTLFMNHLKDIKQEEELVIFQYQLNIQGKIKHYEARMAQLPLDTNIMVIVRDISELKEKDKMLINQSRHAAMGEMIGMIAHQWRQPLSVISMDANNMLADIALNSFSSEESTKYARSITKQVQHLSSTIDDFRNFFKPDKEISIINMEDIITQTLSMVQDSLINNDIKLELTFDTDRKIKAYQRELVQVFVNIITNAKDALVENKIKNSKIDINVFEDNKYINTAISDNAGGIDIDNLPKVFDPYFSTKDEKNGTGLGLYMSKMIVEDHLHGIIEVKNNNEGACFTVRLLKIK